MKSWRKKKTNKKNMLVNKNRLEKMHYSKCLKKIKIKIIDDPIEKAVDYYNSINPGTHVTLEDSKQFLLRLTLNHIRHQYSNYEQLIHQIGSDIYNKYEFKDRVNQVIIERYQLDNFLYA